MTQGYKYITLIFSDNNGPPSKSFEPVGYGGFNHNKIGYLIPLLRIGEILNRKVVFPPPWISLSKWHNNNRNVNKDTLWNTYIDVSVLENLDLNPPFEFLDNNDIHTKLSKKYYISKTNVSKLDNKVDIIILYNCFYKDCKIWSHVQYDFKSLNIKINTSQLLIDYCKKFIEFYKIYDFSFIHLRRGDVLNSKSSTNPFGTAPYTSFYTICNFARFNVKSKSIFIATDEKDNEYIEKLKKILYEYNIITELDIKKILSNHIKEDNYCIYNILNELAKIAIINVGTTGYARLGNKCDYFLSKFVKFIDKEGNYEYFEEKI